ncbi:MAG: argininosuccinate synthase domain-containing protein, partial [Cyclobacteriaceae bacterium]
MKKVILAFSGGLDTSYCALYLSRDLGYEVHTLTVNTGGFSAQELADIEQRALRLGVASHKTVDETRTYYEQVIRFLVFGNILKNGTYPLSVSAERMSQALAVARYANELGAQAVAHGSTGAGNDQVRFDMVIQILAPGLEIITPIRDKKLSREAEIEYLQSSGVAFNPEKARYSINKGIWGTSVGGRETLNSLGMLPEEAWPTEVTKQTPEDVTLGFERGELVAVNHHRYT